MTDVMLDIETMGKGPNAAIVAIGAVAFDIRQKHLDSLDIFYCAIDLQSSVDDGGVMDISTVVWWLNQSDQARQSILPPEGGKTIQEALDQFQVWLESLGDIKNRCIWGNGAAFDNAILAQAYKRAGLAVPWHFWNDRCYRTIKALYPHVKMERIGTHHNALDDATSQAKHLLRMLHA